MTTTCSTPRGLWLCVTGPDALEALPSEGIGWLGVDLQHGAYEVTDLAGLLRATDLPVLARAASQDAAHLARVLDTGVTGVIVPGVEGVQDVQALVRAVRFPPEGARSTGITRSVAVGGPQRPLLLPMVETRGALESVEQVAQVPGVDGLFVGPYDLSLSLGRSGVTDAEVVAAIGRAHAAARTAGVIAGVFSGSRDLDPLVPADLDLVAVDTDVAVMRAGLAALFG